MIEIGKQYRNIHNGIIAKVSQKIFFNIQYYEETDITQIYPKYCHYKRFKKNWIEV